MTSYILLSATVFREPERKTSKAGKPYFVASLKESLGTEGARWWHALTFSESVGAELLELHDGDAAAFRGTFKAEPFERNGETRVSLSIFIDAMLPLKAPPKRTKKDASDAASAAPPAQRAPMRDGFNNRCGAVADGLDDAVPF